jgi:hypothetical protein
MAEQEAVSLGHESHLNVINLRAHILSLKQKAQTEQHEMEFAPTNPADHLVEQIGGGRQIGISRAATDCQQQL